MNDVKIRSMETWKKKIRKISKNWKHGKCEIYQENWKYGKFEKCEIGNMENSENVKDNNRNKRGSIVREGGINCKNLEGCKISKKYYYYSKTQNV